AVHAGEDKAWLLLLHQVPRPHDDAISGRTLHREAPLLDSAQAQWIVQRQRMGNTGLVEFRRDDPYIGRKRTADLGADIEALGMDPIVVGDQNAHVDDRYQSSDVTLHTPFFALCPLTSDICHLISFAPPM